MSEVRNLCCLEGQSCPRKQGENDGVGEDDDWGGARVEVREGLGCVILLN